MSYKYNKFKISTQTWNDLDSELVCITWWIILCIRYLRIFWKCIKKCGEKSNDNNVSIKAYVNKMENRIIFKITTGYDLKLLTTETIKLLESLKNKIPKQDNGKNVIHLEIAEAVLLHFISKSLFYICSK